MPESDRGLDIRHEPTSLKCTVDVCIFPLCCTHGVRLLGEYRYASCESKWQGLSLIDYALLAELAYFDQNDPKVCVYVCVRACICMYVGTFVRVCICVCVSSVSFLGCVDNNIIIQQLEDVEHTSFFFHGHCPCFEIISYFIFFVLLVLLLFPSQELSFAKANI